MLESSPPNRIRALDGLRGLAVLLVLVMHYYVSVPHPADAPSHEWWKRLFALSYTGVDLFFVLSGCLIGGILLDYRNSPRLLPTFYARRFFRIIPLYAALLATFFIAREIDSLRAINQGSYFDSTVPLWSYVMMLQNVAMSWQRDIGPYWLGPTWSLGIEEQFYLFMPFIVRHLSRRQLAYVCLATFIACPLLRTASMFHGGNILAGVFMLPMRAEPMMGGVLAAIVLRDDRAVAFLRAHRALLGGGLALLGAMLALFSSLKFAAGSPLIVSFGYTVVALFFVALVLWVRLFPEGRLARAFSTRALVGLGLISYFVYLFHTPVHYILHWHFLNRPPLHPDWASGGITLIAFGVTLTLGLLSWRLFEQPLLRIGQRFRYQ